LNAFEQRQLTADECAERLRTLRIRLGWQKIDREHELAHEPSVPSESAIYELRTQLAEVFKHGTPSQRKAIIQTHLAEITLSEGKIIPMFRVIAETQTPVEDSTGVPETVRSRLTVAPRLGLEPRTYRLTAGCSAN
jgi:site-specific DNA recombinase